VARRAQGGDINQIIPKGRKPLGSLDTLLKRCGGGLGNALGGEYSA